MQARNARRFRPFLSGVSSLLSLAFAGALITTPVFALTGPTPSATATFAPAADTASGTPFTADKLAALLPATVYFQGRNAPLQIRNAGGTAFSGDGIVWAALVDTSGYSSSVQERYQFYLVTEAPLRIGGVNLPAGAYGAGFLGDHFLIMDVGGHTLAQGPLQTDADLKRPRPLQLLADKPDSVKLYLGRHWVALQPGTAK